MGVVSLAFLIIAHPPANEAAKHVIAQKAGMPNRYHLKLRIESRTPNAPAHLESEWSSTLHLWRDGNKFRIDHLDANYQPPRKSHDSRDRRITCENCEREGYGIITTVRPGPPPIQPSVEFIRLGTRNFDYYCTHFDWRYFGLINGRQCHYPKLHISAEFTRLFDLPGVKVKSADRGGQPCLLAASADESVLPYRATWLSERDGYNPVYFEERFDVPGEKPELRTTEINWQRTPGGRLYPKTVKNKTVIRTGGGQYPSEEVITVTHADFDSAVDPIVFTLSGLGLNENQVIALPDVEGAKQPVWRGGKIDHSYTLGQMTLDYRGAGEAAKAPEAPVGTYPTKGYAGLIASGVAAVLAVAAAAAAVIIRRRRSGK